MVGISTGLPFGDGSKHIEIEPGRVHRFGGASGEKPCHPACEADLPGSKILPGSPGFVLRSPDVDADDYDYLGGTIHPIHHDF